MGRLSECDWISWKEQTKCVSSFHRYVSLLHVSYCSSSITVPAKNRPVFWFHLSRSWAYHSSCFAKRRIVRRRQLATMRHKITHIVLNSPLTNQKVLNHSRRLKKNNARNLISYFVTHKVQEICRERLTLTMWPLTIMQVFHNQCADCRKEATGSDLPV